MYSRVNEEVQQALVSLLGEAGVSSSRAVREHHGKDVSFHSCFPADLVVWPKNTAQVSGVTRICYRHKIPMIPYGSGTGLEGGIGAVKVHNYMLCQL